MHAKPVVFLSHSSTDREALGHLRDALIKKTGGAVDVFLSSAGQSIPLGRNWVHRVEEALASAKIMFVFLSPSSLSSGWVFFESGYAYSRGIRVIPVAIEGVDLGAMSPPLSLLQGFNLTGADTVSNILAVINDEYGFSFDTVFSEEEYADIFCTTDAREQSTFGAYAHLVEKMLVKPFCAGHSLMEAAMEVLAADGIEHYAGRDAIVAFGLAIHAPAPGEGPTTIELDPSIVGVTLPIVCRVLERVGDRPPRENVRVLFEDQVRAIDDPTKQSGRLFGSGVSIAEGRRFQFQDLLFSIESMYRYYGGTPRVYGAELTVELPIHALAMLDLKSLLTVLFDREVLVAESRAAGHR
jgi:hypothetical protein